MAEHNSDTPELLTINAAARRLGIGKHTLREAHERGELPAYATGKRASWRYVNWQEALEWVKSRQVQKEHIVS